MYNKKHFALNEKSFDVNFHTLLDLELDEEVQAINHFPINRKRVYISILDRLVQDLNYFFEVYPDLVDIYFGVKADIHFGMVNSKDELKDIIFERIISDKTLQHYIRDKINHEYNITIEVKSGEEELQFKDSYAKLVICISVMCRLVIPLVCAYMEHIDIKKEHNLILNIFNKIFEVFNVDEEGTNVDLIQKINRFVSTAVENTLYSDKVMWKYLENLSISHTIFAIDLFRKLIKDTVPKLDTNKSIVSFLHVVIKQQILFQFTQNFKIDYRPISPIKTDSNESSISPFTRIEMKLVSADEMQYTIEKENITLFIAKHLKGVSRPEFEYYFKHVQPNHLMIKLISYFINSKDRINIFLCNREEFISMLIITKHYLDKKNFPILSSLLPSDIIPKTDRRNRNLNKGKLAAEIVQSKSYENVLQKYSIVTEKISENNSIITFIGSILNTEFKYLPAFGSTTLSDDLTDVMEYQKEIISEVLSFLERT